MLATLRRAGRRHPRAVTAALSAVGYALVLGVFLGPVTFPRLADGTVLLFGDLIAVVNTAALTCLLAGYWFVRRGEVWRHRAAMLTAFTLICGFLVLYLWKVGGGFEKSIVIREGQFLAAYAGIVEILYLAMLGIHILLSVVAVPVVLYAVILGLTHSPSELRETSHAKYGRIAAASWSLSLFLGVVTYWMLNHVYAWVPR
jgi:putative membrane protein